MSYGELDAFYVFKNEFTVFLFRVCKSIKKKNGRITKLVDTKLIRMLNQ